MNSIDDNKKIGTQYEEDKISAYEVIKWKTVISSSQRNFKNLIQQKTHANDFNDEYIERMGERWRDLQKTGLKLAPTLFLLVIFMGAVSAGLTEGISVFGIRMSNDNSTLVVLLFFSSLVVLYSSLIDILEAHYRGMVKTHIETKKDSQVVDYLMLQYGWHFDRYFKDIGEGCVFHGKAATHYIRKMPPISRQSCHLLHGKAATLDGVKIRSV